MVLRRQNKAANSPAAGRAVTGRKGRSRSSRAGEPAEESYDLLKLASSLPCKYILMIALSLVLAHVACRPMLPPIYLSSCMSEAILQLLCDYTLPNSLPSASAAVRLLHIPFAAFHCPLDAAYQVIQMHSL